MDQNHSFPSAWSTYSRTVFIAFAVIAAGLIAYEHRVHVLGVLPWLLILACPLMHMFMHHGHGAHSGHDHSDHDARMTPHKPKEKDDV
ncbi:Protein of unknown function [Rhizobium mongolense subsp. loessense]|uniref:DUF2933 family protein n=1 Tax=Rhizobium mongolense subsp. loessense TaxID=158890 RepID=A0A1G4TW42_9HYPH|nr:DUF2933 domain-containing protein [Rhizobium mongolense]SCW85548.1 Protein of unknown function [Rhizobium mongolense subsp. loessense]